MRAPQENQRGITRRQFLQEAAAAGGAAAVSPFLFACAPGQSPESPFTYTLNGAVVLPPDVSSQALEINQKSSGFVFALAQDRPGVHAFPILELLKYGEDGTLRYLLQDSTDPQTRYYSYAVSPDRKHIAVVGTKGERDGVGEVRQCFVDIIDMESFESVRLLDNGRLIPVASDIFNKPPLKKIPPVLDWSPDGSFLSFAWAGMIYDIKAKRVEFLERVGQTTSKQPFLWSPVQNEFLARSKENPASPVVLVLQKGGIIGRVMFPFNEHSSLFREDFSNAIWRPDGEMVAVAAPIPGGVALRFFDRLVRMVDKNTYETSFYKMAWSPDGQYIVILSQPGRDQKLTLIQMKDGGFIDFPLQQQSQFVSWPIPEAILIVQNQRALVFSTQKFFERGTSVEKDAKIIPFSGSAAVVELGNPRERSRVALEIGDSDNADFALVDVKRAAGGKITGKGRGLIELESREQKEAEPIEAGDILSLNGRHFYVRNGKRYPITVGIETFKRNSQIKSAVKEGSQRFLDTIPEGAVDQRPVLDWSGQLRIVRPQGGVKPIYASGRWTETNRQEGDKQAVVINIDDTFPTIQSDLKRDNGFDQISDSLYATYNRRRSIQERLFGFQKEDTMQDPLESIAEFSALLKEWKEQFPMERFIPIGHSLGAMIMLHAAYEHLDSIAAFISIDGPLLGHPGITDSRIAEKAFTFYGDKVASYLLRAWRDPAYQKRVRDIQEAMRKRQIPLYTFCSTDDLFIPREVAVLEGATDTINGQKIELAFSMGRSFNPFEDDVGHGAPLTNQQLRNYIKAIVGPNYAAMG